MGDGFVHEELACYRLAAQLSRWPAKQVFPPRRKPLRDQLVQAADSITLNIAEAAGKAPGDGITTGSRWARRRGRGVQLNTVRVELMA